MPNGTASPRQAALPADQAKPTEPAERGADGAGAAAGIGGQAVMARIKPTIGTKAAQEEASDPLMQCGEGAGSDVQVNPD